MKLTKIIKWIISLAFIIALSFYIRSMDWATLKGHFSRAMPIIYLTIPLVFANLAVKIYRLRMIVNSGDKKITLMESAFVQSSSIALATLTPARVGEFSKIYFLNKRDVSLVYSILSLFIERSLDILVLLVGSLLFIQNYVRLTKLGGGILISIIMIILLTYILLFYFGEKLKRLLLKKRFSFLSRPIIKDMTLNSFLSKVSLPKNRFIMMPILITTLSAWLIEAVISWLILRSFGISLNFLVIIAIGCISSLASLFSLLPLGLGSFDFSYAYLMIQSSIPKETALFMVIWLRLLEIMMLFSVIAISLAFRKKNILEIKKGGDTATKNSKPIYPKRKRMVRQF